MSLLIFLNRGVLEVCVCVCDLWWSAIECCHTTPSDSYLASKGNLLSFAVCQCANVDKAVAMCITYIVLSASA